MGVAVEQKIADGQMARRNMDKGKTFAVLLEGQLFGKVKTVVVVALHGIKRTPDREAIAEGFQIAKIPEMPDFIGFREFGQDFFGRRPWVSAMTAMRRLMGGILQIAARGTNH